ncbi:Patatin-like phospholipase domain protein [Paramicrosporidium saccamoebae]|uniref:Patatin-like phospholipase domain protein n=1 Tax=Paramicrosporidium saccamoebae TaxID=1246581 RepID=A0A2H9TPY2_9FUNG|nr:Patatin-like phospholipase domain protein [Paramicrosporidium saccamoebae]
MYKTTYGVRVVTLLVKLKPVRAFSQSLSAKVITIGHTALDLNTGLLRPPGHLTRDTMTTAIATNVATTQETGKHDAVKQENGIAKPYSGRPNPVNVAYEKKMGELDGRIADAKARLASGNKDERTLLIEQAKKLREELRPHQEERRRLFEQLNKNRDDLKKKTGEAQEAKDKLPFRSIPEMEDRVRELESKIESGQFKLIEEKQILAEISKLKKARRAFENIDGSGSDVGSMKLRMDKLRTEINGKDEIIGKFRSQADQVSKKLDEMAGSSKEAQAERVNRQAAIDKVKAEIDAAYEERRKAYEEYKTAKKAQAEARVKRDARRAEYDRRRELEDKLEELEEKLLAFNPETANDRKISECNNLKAFFREALGSDEKDAANEVAAVEAGIRQVKLSDELADAVAINKKKPEAFFVAKGGKKNNKNTATASTVVPLSKLPFHILSALADLSLSIPSTASDVPKLLEAIEAKKSSFTSKKDDAADEKEKQREALEKQVEELKAQLEKPIKTKTEEN